MYLIPSTNMNSLQEKIDVLNRKAKKLKCSPIVLTIVGKKMVEIKALGITLEHFEIEVTGDAPIIHGWSFIATLEHTSEGNIIRTVPGMTVEHELNVYRDGDQKCDHCKQARRRNDTFVLRSENNEYKQIGRQCLKDFLGHKSPEALANYAELLALAGSSCEAYEEDCGGRIDGIGIESYLKWVSLAIRTHGWVSSKMAQESNISKTSQTALWMIDEVRKVQDAPRPQDVDQERAVKALTWIRELVIDENTSDYIYNLYVACKGDSIPWRQCGLVASLFIAYQNTRGGFEKNEKKVSEYQGAIGEKITRTVLVKRVSYSEGNYGTTTIYAMEDSEGNAYTWFSTKDVLKENTCYVLLGTVKDQNDRFKNIKTTVLTRCKVVQSVAA